MELRDGFIVSIFNYCDRWCEACAFTSRCRLFADVARVEAALDPNLKAVAEAPRCRKTCLRPLRSGCRRSSRRPTRSRAGQRLKRSLAAAEPRFLPGHESICVRARAYCLGVHQWLRGREDTRHAQPTDSIAVVAWFASLNASKIHRALTGLAEDDGDREYPPDHDGSAKVAIIGIERSRAAWRQLVESGVVSEAQAQPFLGELSWLLTRLDEVFPMARAFVVRPSTSRRKSHSFGDGWTMAKIVDFRPIRPYRNGMALPAVKTTYSMDQETIRLLDQLADKWGESRSGALRRAIRDAASAAGVNDRLAALDACRRVSALHPRLGERVGRGDPRRTASLVARNIERRARKPTPRRRSR